MGLDNPVHLAFIVVILLLVFGARRLPEIGRSLGSGMREFKDSISGEAKQQTLSTPADRSRETLASGEHPRFGQQPQPVAQQPVAQAFAQQPVAQPPQPFAQEPAPIAQPVTQQPPVAQAVTQQPPVAQPVTQQPPAARPVGHEAPEAPPAASEAHAESQD